MVNVRILEALGSLSRRAPPARTKNRLGRLAASLLGDPPAVKASIGGLRLWLRPADRTASEAFWSGHYEDDVVALLTMLLDPGMTIVDAGANVGLIGLRLADRLRCLGAGRALLIEPVPANMRMLKASVRLNQLDDFCDVFEVGLADAARTVTLLAEGDGQRSGNAVPWAADDRSHRHRLAETTVSLRPLDDLLHDEGDPSIGLMKLDVEGGEIALLRGAMCTITRSRPLIFGEFHAELIARHGASFVDVMDLLAPLGYRAFAFASARHLVEVPSEPGRGDVLLATSEHLPRIIEDRLWRIDLATPLTVGIR